MVCAICRRGIQAGDTIVLGIVGVCRDPCNPAGLDEVGGAEARIIVHHDCWVTGKKVERPQPASPPIQIKSTPSVERTDVLSGMEF